MCDVLFFHQKSSCSHWVPLGARSPSRRGRRGRVVAFAILAASVTRCRGCNRMEAFLGFEVCPLTVGSSDDKLREETMLCKCKTVTLATLHCTSYRRLAGVTTSRFVRCVAVRGGRTDRPALDSILGLDMGSGTSKSRKKGSGSDPEPPPPGGCFSLFPNRVCRRHI